MCGRYTLHHKPIEIEERFEVELESEEEYEARYNIAPTQGVITIRQTDKREAAVCKWGLIPYWAKDPSIGNKMINAKAETLAEKPSFKHAYAKRRCLIPADGFYEWKKESGGSKQPIHIRRRDQGLFAFAGLWEEWKTPEGTKLQSCTIITVEPNELVAEFHHRMAAILLPEDEARWIDPKATIADVSALLRPYPSDLLEAYAVSRAVNSPSQQGPSLIEAV